MVPMIITPLIANPNFSSSSSVIIGYSGNKIKHYQIRSSGTYEIWDITAETNGGLHYIVTDLDKNNRKEVLSINGNDLYQAFDLETGHPIWKLDPPSIDSIIMSIIEGDLTGNGKDELVIIRRNPASITDQNNLVINAEGKLIQIVPTLFKDQNYYGADNGLIYDIDKDGNNELILSFGNVLWNYTSKTGGYRLEIWEWNSEKQELQIEKSWNGTDWGGNTNLLIYSNINTNLIITAGWYNNKIRAWNGDGTLEWERKLPPNENVFYADTRLVSYRDSKGQDHILAIQNNYWTNATLYIYDINPENGKDLKSPILQINTMNSQQFVLDYLLYNFALKWRMNGDNIELYRDLTTLNLEGEFVFRPLPVDSSILQKILYFQLGGSNEGSVLKFDQPSMITQSEDGYIWMVNEDGAKRISDIPLPEVSSIYILNDAPVVDGRLMVNYSQVDEFNLRNYWGILVILLLILVSIIIISFIRDKKASQFHEHFQQNWRVKFYLRLNKIVLRLVREKRIQDSNFELPTIEQSKWVRKKSDALYVKEIKYPVVSRKFELTKLQPYAKNMQHLSLWLQSSNKYAKNLKLGDLSILIDMLDIYPNDVFVSDIISNYNFTSKSTIYSRIRFLRKIKLIDDALIDLKYDDIRRQKIFITQTGLELLTSLYLSLEMTLDDDRY